MRSFKHYFVEALNYHQRSYVDDITHRHADETAVDTEFSDHMFGGSSSGLGRWDDKDVKILPFEKGHSILKSLSRPIINHLNEHGYEVLDMTKKLAARKDVPEGKKARPIAIGKVMQSLKEKGKGDYFTERAWDNYNTIASDVDHGLEVMVTRNPYHVAEQSTNKGWRSCLTLGTCPDVHQGFIGDDEMFKDARQKVERANEQARRLGRANQNPGQFFERVGGDILGGAHMAYLIRKGDYKLKDPLGRVSLKPFHSEDILNKVREYQEKIDPTYPKNYPTKVSIEDVPWRDLKPNHTILRRIGQTYKQQKFSMAHPLITAFEQHVDNLMDEHFPMKPHVHSYYLNHKVQRDSTQSQRLENSNFRSWAKPS
jgi:hypothetical protein